MSNFILFGTEGCHLCEEAAQFLTTQNIAFAQQDIINDEACYERYRLTIPVLHHQTSQAELNWPFDQQQLQTFLASL